MNRVGLPQSPGDWGRGLYVHIPFCIVRCGYCDFNAYAGMDDIKPAYTDALIQEIEQRADGTLTSIFFGGGTPTELPTSHLSRLMSAIRDGFEISKDAEITIECNPESVDRATFERLLEIGFNRFSVGVQSTSPHVLKSLGRVHDALRAIRALVSAKQAGVTNLSADLIFGTPTETMDDWLRSLNAVLDTGVDHVSAYALTVEHGTPLAASISKGAAAPDEDDQADKYFATDEFMMGSGFEKYEVSNWSKPGRWSVHNVGYWQGHDYIGVGAGAHSHFAGRRSWNLKSPQAYVMRTPIVEDDSEQLTHAERVEEAAILGLRMTGGLNRKNFQRVWGVDPAAVFAEQLSSVIERGLVEIEDGDIRLSRNGFLFHGEVAISLMNQVSAVTPV